MPAAAREPSGSFAAETSQIVALFLNHLDRVYREPAAQRILDQIRQDLDQAAQSGKLADAYEGVGQHLSALLNLGETPRTATGHVSSGKPAHPTDSCTGLPLRGEAEELIRQVIEQKKEAFAVVFYLHRMALTNARFGEAIGNQVILFCSQHIATAILRANDSLFRWQGPAFVAVIERPESMQTVNSEIQRLATTPISRHFETPSRSVYLPIRLTSEVVPLNETNISDVLDRIGRFILNTSGQAQNEKD